MSPPFERFISSWSLNSAEAASVLFGRGTAGPAAAGEAAGAALGSWTDGDGEGLFVCSGVGTLTEVSELINPPNAHFRRRCADEAPPCAGLLTCRARTTINVTAEFERTQLPLPGRPRGGRLRNRGPARGGRRPLLASSRRARRPPE